MPKSISVKAVKAGSEIDSLTSGDAILEWVKGKATGLAETIGGKLAGWLTSQVLKELGHTEAPSQLDEIQEALDSISKAQARIEKGIKSVMTEVKFQRLIQDKHGHDLRIISRYDDMRALIRTPLKERVPAINRLRKAILDGNLGASIGLKAIHDLLVEDSSGDNEGLIHIFMKRWLAHVQDKEMDENFPVARYNDHAQSWLHGVFIIQYMALNQLINAYLLSEEHSRIDEILKLTAERMQIQKDLLDSFIPDWCKDVPRLFNGRWHLIEGKTEGTVLYGDPPHPYYVRYRPRHAYNPDEEWGFVPCFKTDLFKLRKRNSTEYSLIMRDDDRVLLGGSGEKTSRLRLVIKDRAESAGNKEAVGPRRDSLFPALADIDHKKYLCLDTRYKDLWRMGEKKDAEEIRIAESNHYVDGDVASEMGKRVAIRLDDGARVFFQGFHCIRLAADGITTGPRMLVRDAFPNTPFDYVTAILARPDNKLYLFQHGICALYDVKKRKVVEGYPKAILDAFPKLVFQHIDAVIPTTNGQVIFVEHEEAALYDVEKRAPITGPKPLGTLLPGLPLDRIKSCVVMDDQTVELFRRGNCTTYDPIKGKVDPGGPALREIDQVWPTIRFPTYIRPDGTALPSHIPKSPKPAPQVYFHQQKWKSNGRSGCTLSVRAENRLNCTFKCVDRSIEHGDADLQSIQPLGVSNFFWAADSIAYGPEGWALYKAEENPDISFRVCWDLHKTIFGAYDMLLFKDMNNCVIGYFNDAPLYFPNSLFSITISYPGGLPKSVLRNGYGRR